MIVTLVVVQSYILTILSYLSSSGNTPDIFSQSGDENKRLLSTSAQHTAWVSRGSSPSYFAGLEKAADH